MSAQPETNRPHCVKIAMQLPVFEKILDPVSERLVRLKSRVAAFIPRGSVLKWDEQLEVFIFSDSNTYITVSWDNLKKCPHSWEALGFDSNNDGDCIFCAPKQNVK